MSTDDKPGAGAATAWPRVAASAAIFRENRILIVERGKPPVRGLWSLPGGHIEPGETARAAALRELEEETGVTASLLGVVDVHDVIMRDATGALATHYVLAVYYGRWTAGEPTAASDCLNARFVELPDLPTYPLTNGALRIIEAAHRLLASFR